MFIKKLKFRRSIACKKVKIQLNLTISTFRGDFSPFSTLKRGSRRGQCRLMHRPAWQVSGAQNPEIICANTFLKSICAENPQIICANLLKKVSLRRKSLHHERDTNRKRI